jgi:hypothetical protein
LEHKCDVQYLQVVDFLVELVGIELLRGIENTQVIHSIGGQKGEKGTIAG